MIGQGVWILWGVENCPLPLTKPVTVQPVMDRTPPCTLWFHWTSKICKFVFTTMQMWDWTISCIFSGSSCERDALQPRHETVDKTLKSTKTNKEERASCLFGLSRFLQTFYSQHFSTVASPLAVLDDTWKGALNRFECSDAQIQAFAKLKQHIVSSPILCLAVLQWTFILLTHLIPG